MINLPNWIPSPTAWMSSLLLILLMRGLSVLVRVIFEMGEPIIAVSPKLRFVLYFAALLSPILIITIAHHLLHIILDRFYPNTSSPEINANAGQFPSLMSWWEGFYGWMAVYLAMIVSSMIQLIFLPLPDSYNLLGWWNELKDLFTLPTLYQIITAAYLYQFEHLVREHLMSVGAHSRLEQ